MKKAILYYLLLLMPEISYAQIGEKTEPGFLIDKFGARYDGLLRYVPGDGKSGGEIIFRESKKSKKNAYRSNYVTAFKIEADSFTILKNIPLANKKVIAADFAKVTLVGPGGVIYFHEFKKSKSTGHAATDYKIAEENTRYLMSVNGKLTILTKNNFKNFAMIVSDHKELKNKILAGKAKFADLEKLIAEYKTFKEEAPSSKQ